MIAKYNNRSGFVSKWLVGALTLVVLIGLGIGGTLVAKRNRNAIRGDRQPSSDRSQQAGNGSRESTKTLLNLATQWGSGKCKGNGPVAFTHPPMNYNDIGIVLPYGLLADAHVTPVDHMYFSPKNFRSERDAYPVYAIADGTITRVSHRGSFVGDQQSDRVTDEYQINIEYTCNFFSYYDLLTSLSPELAAKLPTDNKEHWNKQVNIPITAGQEIGRVGGQTVDWGVYNTEVTLDFIEPKNYNYEPWKIHTDPNSLTYFTDEIETRLTALLARQAEPRVGQINYDIDGKLIGNWFLEGTNGYGGKEQQRYWDGHLAIVPDYIDPTQIRFSVGNFSGKAAQFGVKGNTPDPATVGLDAGRVTYELQKYSYYDKTTGQPWMSSNGPIAQPGSRNNDLVLGVALVQLIEPRKLKVEIFPEKTSAQVTGFTDKAQLYTR